MSEQVKPIQKILFGSPGTGKSYQVREIARNELLIPFDEDTKTLRNTIKTVFHPEYTYADFMGKLLPLTQNGSIIYKFYPGHFLRILSMAYKALIDGSQENFLLVIDELNRGNAAAIFGTVFQLLDRESDGWSSYEVDISDMELFGLLEAMHLNPIIQQDGSIDIDDSGAKRSYKNYLENKASQLNVNNPNGSRACNLLKQRRINIPSNLSIIATINTSDESIYYLDSAFKRRWDWEYVNAPSGKFTEKDIPLEFQAIELTISDYSLGKWSYYIIGINEFIKSNYQSIRRIEDKQIGWWFIKPEGGKVEIQQVRDKLMFYLWDSVFTRDKKPLESLLSIGDKPIKLTQYSDFLSLIDEFMEKIYELGSKNHYDDDYE
jgi:5-methylcytosine-specific restriction endonuclease McrBC GTP-binding regulatory subunit McrB